VWYLVKHREDFAFTFTSKQVGLEVNARKLKYAFMFCHQNAGQNHNIKRANKACGSGRIKTF
jgi:hypothetical protein